MTLFPAPITFTAIAATRARNDDEIVASWLDSFNSDHTRRNFETTARRFLIELPMGMRHATVEDVREAFARISAGLAPSSGRQVVLRIKSLLTYAHKSGYLQFNAGVMIKVRSEARSVAKRIVSEVDIGFLVRAATTHRDRVLVEVGYGGGLRVSEIVGLSWCDIIERPDNKVQLSVLGKGGKVRQVLLPTIVSRSLLSLRGDSSANDPVFTSRKGGARLSVRAVQHLLTRLAELAGVNPKVSPHYLRHAHGSHAIDRGATLVEVQATLGHANISTTSGYLHARPDSSSGLKLDEGVFLNGASL